VGNTRVGLEWSRRCNDLVHRVTTLFPDRLDGVAQLPRSPGDGIEGWSVQASGRAEVDAMIDYLSDVGGTLNGADPAQLEELYGSLCPEVIYEPGERIAQVSIRPGRGSERV